MPIARTQETSTRRRSRRGMWSVLLGVCLMASGLDAMAARIDPANIKWSELRFSASVFFFTVKADIRFKSIPAAQASAELINPDPAPASSIVMPSNDSLYLLTSNTANFGRNTTLEFWFEPDLTALQRTQTETGRRNIVRTYRYFEAGAYRLDKLPAPGEENSPPGNWTQESSQYYPYPANLPPLKMTDNNVIFYAVSAADLRKKNDKLAFLTFDKEHINQVEIVMQGTEALETEYEVQSKGGKKRVRETVQAFRLSIKSKPVDKNVAADEFTFLGVKGDITMYIHPKTRMPLQVSGKADYVGQTNITLERAVLRE